MGKLAYFRSLISSTDDRGQRLKNHYLRFLVL